MKKLVCQIVGGAASKAGAQEHCSSAQAPACAYLPLGHGRIFARLQQFGRLQQIVEFLGA